MVSLAPKILSNGSIKIRPEILSVIEIMNNNTRAFPKIFSASSFLPSPNLIDDKEFHQILLAYQRP